MCSRGENLLTYFFVFSMHDATTRSSLIKHKINIERKKKKQEPKITCLLQASSYKWTKKWKQTSYHDAWSH
jgi:hypothetical protein